MKAAGVNIVATYVIGFTMRRPRGSLTGRTARRARIHPALPKARHVCIGAHRSLDHGEARNGGFPDWVIKASATRVNDRSILPKSAHVWANRQQLNGLLWKDGGPWCIQLENEYSQRGPGRGRAYLQLKKIAIESGLDVPLYW